MHELNETNLECGDICNGNEECGSKFIIFIVILT